SRLVLPDLGQEGHEAPQLVEVARPVLECHAEAIVDEPRHFPYPLREEPPILTAIDDRDEVGTSPLDDDLAFPDLEGSQLVGGAVPVAGAMNSMSIRGPETDAEGLPFPSVNSKVKTKLATRASRGDPKVIPRMRASPGDREEIVQLYRLPWLDRGIEPLSDRKRGPFGKVVLSQPMPAACPALRTVKVRTNRDVVLSWTAEAVMPRVKEGARRS